MADLRKIGNFINGQTCAPRDGQYLEKCAPSTGEPYLLVPASDQADVNDAVHAAREIYPWWSRRTPEQRSQVLLSVAARLEQSTADLTQGESFDVGQPLALSREIEIPRAIAAFRYYGTKILHGTEVARSSGTLGTLAYRYRAPVGVAGLITSWVSPLASLAWKIAPALACGNTVVAKPSAFTPFTASLLGDLFNEAGVPHGVVNIVFGRGEHAGAALAAHPQVSLVTFNGRSATAQKVKAAATPTRQRARLETSARSRALVFADADLAEAVLGTVRAAFHPQNENQLAHSIIFVEEEIFSAFCEKFARMVSLLRLGDPEDRETQLGPLLTRAHHEQAMAAIRLARQDGGSIVSASDSPHLPASFLRGYFLEPTVITGLPLHSRFYQEEILGPVVALVSFRKEKEALSALSSLSPAPSAVLWTKDPTRAQRVAQALEVESLWVNGWGSQDPALNSQEMLDFFSAQKVINLKA